MKKQLFFLMGLCLSLVLSACSSSSDDEFDPISLDTPKYSDFCAKYVITSADAEYSSVEFTESGDYIIRTNTSTYAASPSEAGITSILTGPWQPTRATWYLNIIHGKYTMTDENTFVLEGFGTIHVTKGSGSAVSLEITKLDGSSPTPYPATKEESGPGKEKTIALCRTWGIESIRMIVRASGDGRSFNFDETIKGGDLKQLYMNFVKKLVSDGLASSSTIERYESILVDADVKNVIFTQAGSYIVTYEGDYLAVSTWTWNNYEQGILRYSWDYSSMTSPVASNNATVKFSGKKCILEEEQSQAREGSSVYMKMTYNLVEEK